MSPKRSGFGIIVSCFNLAEPKGSSIVVECKHGLLKPGTVISELWGLGIFHEATWRLWGGLTGVSRDFHRIQHVPWARRNGMGVMGVFRP